MRSEYVRRPIRSWVSASDTPEDRPSCTIYEPEGDPIDTGLLDADGTRLYRIEIRDRIGFVIR